MLAISPGTLFSLPFFIGRQASVRGRRENDQNLSEGTFVHPALGDFGQLFLCINVVGNLEVEQSMVWRNGAT